MHDADPRPPLLPPRALRSGKIVLSVFAAGLMVVGGLATFGIAAVDLADAISVLVGEPRTQGASRADQAIVSVVKSVDSVLLALVQFLLAAFLWQILDPRESLLDDENLERLEEAKQILCKVVLVIVAVRMLGVVVEPEALLWQHLVYPAGIVALALATHRLGRKPAGA
jgi:uncharacterized membrane protein YqhA